MLSSETLCPRCNEVALEGAICHSCTGVYHFDCSVRSVTWRKYQSTNYQWKCHSCRSNEGTDLQSPGILDSPTTEGPLKKNQELEMESTPTMTSANVPNLPICLGKECHASLTAQLIEIIKDLNVQVKALQVSVRALESVNSNLLKNIPMAQGSQNQTSTFSLSSTAFPPLVNVSANQEATILINSENKDEDTMEILKSVVQRPEEEGWKVHSSRKNKSGTTILKVDQKSKNLIMNSEKLASVGLKCSEPKKNPARLAIYEVPEEISTEEIIHAVVKVGKGSVAATDIIKCFQLKSKFSTKKWILEVSTAAHKNLTTTGRIFIGWSSYKMKDYVSVTRCYKCQWFHHISAKCERDPVCGWCGKDHESKDCDRRKLPNCVNCLRSKTNCAPHPVWSSTCPTYLRLLLAARENVTPK